MTNAILQILAEGGLTLWALLVVAVMIYSLVFGIWRHVRHVRSRVEAGEWKEKGDVTDSMPWKPIQHNTQEVERRYATFELDEIALVERRLPFLGVDALSSLSVAQLALKYDVPMIPAYGIRNEDGNSFCVDFEDPIPHTDSVTMTRAFNDSLSARIMTNPDQWYWMLRRWGTK